jgi:asparagine synthase (glutamine-hydrolysing)
MCGLFAHWGSTPIAVDAVLAALQGRGPDDRGQWQQVVGSGVLQFLHARLAIQDLSPAGHQPMHSADGRFTIVFNGEIYNAPELRRELQRDGVDFRSHSDTEVILEGFSHWGEALFSRLNGIFALTLWDNAHHAITLARDRFGVKPLLWCIDSGGWAVASELSALRAAGRPARPRLDRSALEQFWQWGAVQAPRTLVEAVQSFPAGHWARWQAHQPAERWHVEAFSALPTAVLTPADLSYAEAVQAVADALARAVNRQMLADVPVGAFLSGGLDSSALVALMASCSTAPLRTFSLGFTKGDLSRGVVDERSLAACTARHFATEHHELVVSAAEVSAQFNEFCLAIDQPSVDGLNTFLVARAARDQGLSVAVSGLGGDEVFGGYPVFQRAWRFQNDTPLEWNWPAHLPWRVLQRFGWEYRRFGWGSVAALASHRRLQAGSEPMGVALTSQEQELDLVAQLTRLELRGYMANVLLRDADAVTMHCGLELRVPFLDNDLVDLLLSLPSVFKFRPGYPKPLLIDAIGHHLPDQILQQPKRGFELPLASWLKTWQPPSLAPELLGAPWPARIEEARHLFRAKPHRYHGWWQWQVLSSWLTAWPTLLDG